MSECSLVFFPTGNRVRTDCTEFRSTSCQPCYEGTYMNHLNKRTWCFPCTNCDAGSGLKIHTACTTTSDTVCEPLEGFYCLDPAGSSCVTARKHSTCKPGQYISQIGWCFQSDRLDPQFTQSHETVHIYSMSSSRSLVYLRYNM
uniref:Tumor necrosis factor receptor superfamily member 14 n=1 Tax=Larimichthys crocea TaxID=215358 RepID=A0A0F8AJE6_LARCR